MLRRRAAALCLTLFTPGLAAGYSVLAHEAIVDAVWEGHLRPLLLKRFPAATPEELVKAHGYAYGGAIIQDLGYYPLGSRFFSDLTHYVRSGDFVMNLLSESQDLNEYAFALGAVAHHAADNNGHAIATNRAVPMLFPKLRRRFGDIVTYDNDALSHAKVEFGFDVVQVAEHHYAPDAYRDFIGFEVAKPVLERAFLKTYAVKLGDLFVGVDLALGTYRYAVSSVIPGATKMAWATKRDQLQKSRPGVTKQKFIYNLKQSSYRKEWGGNYRRPGFRVRFFAFLLRILPRVGPLKALSFVRPTPETERLFMESFNKTLEVYRARLGDVSRGTLRLVNDNFDTGQRTRPGSYGLADRAYAKLLERLSRADSQDIPPELRADVLAYYADLNAPISTKSDPKAWNRLLDQLEKLKASGDGAGRDGEE
jgi:zinc dependent phospholipase C